MLHESKQLFDELHPHLNSDQSCNSDLQQQTKIERKESALLKSESENVFSNRKRREIKAEREELVSIMVDLLALINDKV